MPPFPLHLGRSVSCVLRQRETIAWWVALFPLLFVCLIIVAKLVAPTLYRYAVAENNLVELATFVAYLAVDRSLCHSHGRNQLGPTFY
jgi:hypothetical protein